MFKKPLLFFASVPGEMDLISGKNALLSYFFLRDLPLKKQYQDYKTNFGYTKLFIDSGAFSAFTTGRPINIEKYCYFVKNINCDYYAGLDVIGDSLKTKENLKFMERRGLHPLPTFHFGEEEKYLQEYCKDYDYICLGGMVGRPEKQLELWLDRIFQKYPDKKFHGFGLTNIQLCYKYPWYSFDSSSWTTTAIFGSIVWDFGNSKLERIGITPQQSGKPGHIDNLQPNMKQKWMDLFDKLGYKKEDLMHNAETRKTFNANAYAHCFSEDNKTNISKEFQKPLVDSHSFKRINYPEMEKDKSVQRTFKNLCLGFKKVEYGFTYHQQCVECGFKFESKKENPISLCPKCCSKSVTSPIETKVRLQPKEA